MPDTYAIGSIPPISAWEGHTATFTVTGPAGSGTKFSIRPSRQPKGKIAIGETTGIFTYTPTSDDREDFTVVFRAGQTDQTVLVAPQPRVPSDFNIIEHVSNPPDPASRLYLTYFEKDVGKAVFNNQSDYTDEAEVKIETKQVTVVGVKLIIDRSNDPAALYKKLNDRTDLRELTLCADEVVIRSPINLPGTEVCIYARILRFEAGGSINTTPLSVRTAPVKGIWNGDTVVEKPGRNEGLRGQSAANVYLLAQKIETEGGGPFVIANGANGQPARAGTEGKPGASYKIWDGRYEAKSSLGAKKWLELAAEIKAAQARDNATDYPVVSAEIWAVGQAAPSYKVTCIINGGVKDNGDPMKEVPTSGSAPKAYPGAPGHGGDGGRIVSTLTRQLEGLVSQNPGVVGAMAQNVPAAAKGTPSKWSVVKVTYHPQYLTPDLEMGGVFVMFKNINMETEDGPPGIAPGPNPDVRAYPGSLTQAQAAWAWLNADAVRAFIGYARDLILSGHTEGLREKLVVYRDTTAHASQHGGFVLKANHLMVPVGTSLTASALADELTGLIQILDGPYDYFGNPAGWVPMLSFQANYELFEAEVKIAIRVMFLAHWLETTSDRKQKAATSLEKVVNSLREETDKALADYDVAQNKIGDLDSRLIRMTQDIEDNAKELSTIETALRSKVKGDLKVEHILRSSGKIIGGAMQLIPVGQPVTGSFGKSVTALADIDLDDWKGSAVKIASPLAKVAAQKIGEKAKKAFTELKSAKEKEKKDAEDKDKAFKEALAEAELEEKVEKHMEEQKAAKDSIIDAFKGFAVTEEDIDERLEKVLADAPGYKEIVEKVKDLNKRKASFMEELLSVLDTIHDCSTTILKNQLALIKLRGQLNVTLEGLNPEAVQYVRDMGQRARDRLLLYQYYLVKSYQYLMLKDLPIIDYRSQKLIDGFANALKTSPDGTLSSNEYDKLRAIFEDQLSEVGKTIIQWYQSHAAKHTGNLRVNLTKEQIATLNKDDEVELDLLWALDSLREDIRITGIETAAVQLAQQPTEIRDFSIEYRHDGISRIRAGGLLYLFRTGQYRIASGKGEPTADQYRNDKTYWTSDITYNPPPVPSPGARGTLTIEESKIDASEESLIRKLIKGNADEKNPLLSFRPSAWTKLMITRSGNYKGDLTSLTLNVKYVFNRVSERLSTLVVKGDHDNAPLIRCEPLDVNQCGDGYGSFVRTYDKEISGNVTLRAPARYAQRSFVGWRVGTSEQPGSGALRPDPLLKLDLKKRDQRVEAVYETASGVPVEEDKNVWPPAPAGWNRDDWTLTNKSPREIRLATVNAIETVMKEVDIVVNEPLGDHIIKLSFDRVEVQPGGMVRISVATNPAERRGDRAWIRFEWNDGREGAEGNFNVYFAMDGSVSSRRKRYDQESAVEEIGLDVANRVLTFKG